MLLMEGADERSARRVGNGILDNLRSRPLNIRGQQLLATVTIGIATSAAEISGEELFEAADRALYEGKRRGGNGIQETKPIGTPKPLAFPSNHIQA